MYQNPENQTKTKVAALTVKPGHPVVILLGGIMEHLSEIGTDRPFASRRYFAKNLQSLKRPKTPDAASHFICGLWGSVARL
jgi:hypothetical protein